MTERADVIAVVRAPGVELARCELTHLERSTLDVGLAQLQHKRYVAVLRSLVADIEWLPPLPQQPDAVFVEDTAFILPEIAVIARPGSRLRQSEVASTAAALARYRPLTTIVEPGCIDGGDILRIGHTIYVGLSGRTNAEGARQFARAVNTFGYEVRTIHVSDCLHLKTAVTFIPPAVVILNPTWVDAAHFAGLTCVAVAEHEPFAANTLTIAGNTLVSAAYPNTMLKLRALGLSPVAVDIGELHKAEAGVTCLNLLIGEASE